MASSRKARSTADPLERTLLTAVQSAVVQSLPQQSPLPAKRRHARAEPSLIVAYSGGRDSTALLHLVRTLRDEGAPHFGRPVAVHVDHGLQPEAQAWAQHCQRQAEAWNVPFLLRRVPVQRRGQGLEAAAREARYAALLEVARETGAVAVLSAHHLDDRIETFLLQWIRGAGPHGLTAMEVHAPLARVSGRGAGGEGYPAVVLVRPLLHTPRHDLERYIERHALPFIEDPSNQDVRLDRNAIRLRVMPELAKIRAGFRAAAERSVELIAEAADVARAVAREDLAVCTRDAAPGTLRIDRLAMLPPARQAPVLREWLADAGLQSPPRARLREALAQAIHAASDARVLVRIGEHELRRHHGLLCLVGAKRHAPTEHALQWRGEQSLAVPEWGGTLVFRPTEEEGFDTRWLRSEPLQLRPRTGGERFKPHPTRPSKRLKQVFQDARIPEYERSGLPLVWRDGRLIFVAGIGPDVRMLVAEGERVRMEWVGAARLLAD